MNLQKMTPLLNVKDVSKSIQFYQDCLGFEVVQTWENEGKIGWASLEKSGIKLMLNGSHVISPSDRKNRQAHTDAVFYFYVDDVDSLHNKLNELGVEVGDIEDEFYGVRDFYLRDPDGYELGFGMEIKTPRIKIVNSGNE